MGEKEAIITADPVHCLSSKPFHSAAYIVYYLYSPQSLLIFQENYEHS